MQKAAEKRLREMRHDEHFLCEALAVIKRIKAPAIAGEAAHGAEIFPFFHGVHANAHPHGGGTELCCALGRDIAGQENRFCHCLPPAASGTQKAEPDDHCRDCPEIDHHIRLFKDIFTVTVHQHAGKPREHSCA